ncbi:MAG: HIT family protein [Nanoarchaeota archaeon]|nr:HIT family protein [Nanoarchaeota archaeon]
MTDCIFCKIAKGEIPTRKIYENERVIAFLDISPVNKGHALVIPRKHSEDLTSMDDENIAAVFTAAKKIAPALMKATGATGFNIGMNNRKSAGQLVFHSHVHIIPRFDDDGLKLWSGKELKNETAKELVEAILKEI